MNSMNKVKVWDPLVRFSHWLLAVCFLIAYLSEDDFMGIHAWSGYIIIMLLIIRLVWGLIGNRYARFSNFATTPAIALQYTKDTLCLRSVRYIGHNPAGGLMIIIMLITLSILSLSGLVVYGIEEQAGPLAPWLANSGEWLEDISEEVHEFMANLMLILIAIHLLGVLVESLIHRENLVRSMINGYKRL
jgi:cytochrome b